MEDLDALAEVLDDPEVMRYVGKGEPRGRTRDESERTLRTILEEYERWGHGLLGVTTPADDSNRAVEIIAESHNFYSSSVIQLDGEKAPTTTTVEFRSVPVGLYSVRVIVKGAGGKEVGAARTEVNIVGR